MREEHERRWRIAVDIGGTFTDLVLIDGTGDQVFKVPSVPDAPVEGVVNALDNAAASLRLEVVDLLSHCELFLHGSTVATNTLLEHKGARLGLLCTAGFRDSLEIRRGMRADIWAHRDPFPEVLVPRSLRRPVRGRLDRQGTEIEPLAIEDVRDAATHFTAAGVEAVAVCFINSFLDAAHERAAAIVLEECWGGQWIAVSHDVVPIMGEYERCSTVVLNAYVAPRTVGYVRHLVERLGDMGLHAPLLLIQNNGGAVSADNVAARPATLLLSGPAAGVGALNLYRRLTGSDDLISMEIGGTSCDAMLMSGGEVAHTDLLELDAYHLALPSVDLHTIGVGGGTIAGVDAGGMLFVGPRGAGADPGPACYGLGGEEPTVTDAQLVLGRLEPQAHAGDALVLDLELARAAVRDKLAGPLGLSVEEAAQGVIRLMEQALLHAMQRISVERGHDPRRFTLVACGGAGPLHGATVARLLGCPRVYVPRLAGVFCALGMLHSDVRHDFVRAHLVRLDKADPRRVRAAFEDMQAQGEARLAAEGFRPADRATLHACDLRYQGQQWDVRVALAGARLDTQTVRAAFEREHQRLYGHVQPDGVLEVTKLRLTAVGLVRDVPLGATPKAANPKPVGHGRRKVWVDPDTGWTDVSVFDGAGLEAGYVFDGPALINEATTTVFIGAGDRLTVDTAGNYAIEVAQ